MMTFLAQVSAILNSRPLYALSDEPSDCQALTPGHFMIGEPFIAPPNISLPAQSDYSLQRIHQEQKEMLESFWNRWQDEYLTSLMQRKKWQKEQKFEIGQLVIIKDDNRPPAQWLLGRISKLIPSNDGIVRSVHIKLPDKDKKKRELIRAVQSLVILPVETTDESIAK